MNENFWSRGSKVCSSVVKEETLQRPIYKQLCHLIDFNRLWLKLSKHMHFFQSLALGQPTSNLPVQKKKTKTKTKKLFSMNLLI